MVRTPLDAAAARTRRALDLPLLAAAPLQPRLRNARVPHLWCEPFLPPPRVTGRT
jgi:hypothetical protein